MKTQMVLQKSTPRNKSILKVTKVNF